MATDDLLADLVAERAHVRALVAALDADAWLTETPAAGWTIRDQIWHLAAFDDRAARGMTEPEAFAAETADAITRMSEYQAEIEAEGRQMSGAAALAAWDAAAERFDAAVRGAAEGQRVPWYATQMSVPSKVTARLMETWAHGVDVSDTLGAPPSDSPRVGHVAFIAWRAVPFTYANNRREPPEGGFRLELECSDGTPVVFGPEDAAGRVSGDALEFALVAVQRRHPADTSLQVEGTAQDWVEIIQAYAGPPGAGRGPTGVPAREPYPRSAA